MTATLTLPDALSRRYEPLRRLGAGGMGEVIAARDRLLGREVAVKLLRPDRRPEEGRLREEFGLLASLDHPGVVRVHDVGLAEGVLYLTSELLDGERLDAWLDRSPPPEAVQALLSDVLATLAWLHAEGVVHADIKPANVLLLMAGGRPWPVLIDFGLAHAAGYPVTPLGGTPTYMAPELRDGRVRRPTPRTDLFALGRCLQPWAEAHPDAPAAALVDALCQADPWDRPASADAALAELEPDRSGQHHLGGRGLEALWGAPIRRLAREIAATPGCRVVRLPSPDDAGELLRSLKASLELSGEPAVLIDASVGSGLWSRLVAALGGPPALEDIDAPRPEDYKEAIEARAATVIEALHALPSRPPALLVARPEALDAPARHVLGRVVESGALPRIVLASGRGDAGFEPGPTAREELLPDPGLAEVKAFLEAHAVAVEPPAAAADLLTARARAGATALRALLDVWVRDGVLRWEGAGWSWAAAERAAGSDAPTLDALWTRLWEELPDAASRTIALILALGGRADAEELATLDALDRGVLARLSAEGWISAGGAGGAVALREGPARRLGDGRLDAPALDPALGRDVVAVLLGSDPDDAGRQSALARQLTAAGRRIEAAEAWWRVAEVQGRRMDPALAGQAALETARLLSQAGDAPQRIVERAERAVRQLQQSADARGVAEGLAIAREAARSAADPALELRAETLAARVAAQEARPEDALEAVRSARALIDEGTAASDDVRLDLRIALGVSLAHLGRSDEAADALEEAADLAEGYGDLHGAGRVLNNLGIVHFHRRDFGRAAAAWSRAAAIKRDIGDVRGQRISSSNRGLALREMGRISEAIEAAGVALEVARRIGDRRGEAMGCLALAQAWLDVGDADQAAGVLEELADTPIASELVAGDAEVVQTRLTLCRGDATAASAQAARIVRASRDKGLKTLEREAWGLAYVAWVRAGVENAPSEALTIVLGDDPVAEAAALIEAAQGRDPVLLSCLTHAEALGGSFAEAEAHLEEGLGQIGEVAVPGAVLALAPLEQAAELLARGAARARIRTVSAATLRARHGERLALDEANRRPPTPVGTLAEALGLAELVDDMDAASARNLHSFEGHSSIADAPTQVAEATGAPTGTDATQLGMTAPQRTTLDTLTRLQGRDLREPGSWAAALRDVAAADSCEVYAYRDGETSLVASDGGDSGRSRWSAVARRLVREPRPFVARRDPTRTEAVGLPLLGLGDGDPVGSVFLAWPDGAGEPAETLTERLTTPASLAALAVEGARLRATLQDVIAEIDGLRARNAELAEAHRQEVTALREALEQSRSELALEHSYEDIVHASRAMRRVLRTLEKVSDTDLSVLILGESGVGKELLARVVHRRSPRRDAPFVAENCGAVPADLFESVFFGHVRGAFTGAHTARKGLVELAHGGTLFLDELGELRPDHQVKLLRVLQERRFRPVGAQQEREADFRLVAATNRDLQEQVESGAFREDLYYRVAVVSVEVPPLRERPDDIVPLAQRFLEVQGGRMGRELRLTPEAANALLAHDWPGNVRELENEILRAAALCDGDSVRPVHLSPRVIGRDAGGATPTARVAWDGETPLEDILAAVEADVIRRALESTDGKKAPAARLLGVSRPGLDGKIDRLGIDARAIRKRAKARKVEET